MPAGAAMAISRSGGLRSLFLLAGSGCLQNYYYYYYYY